MTDADLLMLENLTYIDDKFHTTTGLPFDLTHYDSLGEFFDNVFTDDVLANFDAGFGPLACDADNNSIPYNPIDGGENSSQEWAAMIRYMKSNDEIRNMRVVDAPQNSNGKTFAMRFEPTPGHAGNPVVAFRGTLDGKEWKDNVDGMILADTEAQREALDYIESIPSDNITVVGHSKGGNKAQYVAILSDKVTKAVSYDGQGFSKAFIDKYSAEIAKNAKNKIRCYGLDTDYVHGLLYNMPNADQVYVSGGTDVTDAKDVKQHHSPDAFFTYTQNEKGEWVIEIVNDHPHDEKEENTMYFALADAEKVQMIHRFTVFVMNVAPEDTQGRIADFVGAMLAISMGGGSKEELNELLFSGGGEIGTLIAYLVLFFEKEGKSPDEIRHLLDDIQVDFNIPINLNEVAKVVKGESGHNAIDNWIHKKTLAVLGGIGITVKTKASMGPDIGTGGYSAMSGANTAYMNTLIEAAYNEYKKGNREYKKKYGEGHNEAAFEDPKPAVGRIWDFSEETYNTLMQINAEMRNLTIPGAEWWAEYAHYRWYSNIDAGGDHLWFKENAKQLYEKCGGCESKINTVFDREKEIYNDAIGKLDSICEDLIEARGKLAEKISAIYNNV